MGKSSGHNVGVADSYARRTADQVVLQMHLPGLADAGSVGVRLVSLGKGACSVSLRLAGTQHCIDRAVQAPAARPGLRP